MKRFDSPDTYAVWSKNENIRFESTSGGAFSELAKIILDMGGVIAGAKYNEKNLVEHTLIRDDEELEIIRQSKYMSSSLNNIYKEVQCELQKGGIVAFCGSPCQVAGLYSYLGEEHKNLYTMDFICRGMNSPKAFSAWIKEIENEKGSRVKKVWFKYKEGGWKTSPRRTRLDFDNGEYKVYEGKKNLYMDGYLTSNLYIRRSCGNCHFKGIPRKSDITFADFWGIEKELDDDKGTSLILVNSEKGRDLLSKAQKNLEIHQKEFSSIFDGNPMFASSVSIPKNGHDFLLSLDNISFSKALEIYSPRKSIFDRIIRKIKVLLKKI